jgi:hypothetical protein
VTGGKGSNGSRCCSMTERTQGNMVTIGWYTDIFEPVDISLSRPSLPSSSMARLCGIVSMQTPFHSRSNIKLTCFHVLTISGIPSIAFLLFSSFAGILLSQICPFTFCPSPVPLTLKPCSNNLASLKAVDLRLGGNRGSTPCFLASLTRSACRRREYFGARQRLVSGLRQGRKGLGLGPFIN